MPWRASTDCGLALVSVLHHVHRSDAYFDATEDTVKAITLRNLPEHVGRAVRERASKYRVSLNKAVAQLLEEALGGAPRPAERHDDMDHLFGALSAEDGDALERAVAEMRRTDLEHWE
jgi:plasmid stability protein